MSDVMRAVEVEGTIDETGVLHLDLPLPVTLPARVRVILLIDQSKQDSEGEWLYAASRNEAFQFLNEPGEDIYTSKDGKQFKDEA